MANIDEGMFEGSDKEQFKDHYRDANEELPDRMTRPRGRMVKVICFVDASHVANKVNRKSHTGYVIFINRAPIIPIDGTSDILCDNQSVVNNSFRFESTLNKKHASIAYHAVRWSVAAGMIRVGKVYKDDNLADAFTKRLPAIKREYLFGNWTY